MYLFAEHSKIISAHLMASGTAVTVSASTTTNTTTTP